MLYEEIVKKAKNLLEKVDASSVGEHIAIQVDVVGDGEGAFYVEANDGKIVVEPYEYYDNDCKVKADAASIVALFSGKLDVEEALSTGKISVEGDGGKALTVVNVIKDSLANKIENTKESVNAKTVAKKVTSKKKSSKK